MEIQGCHQFRVTRNSDLYVETEEVDDLMRAVEGELMSARYGEAVRLEIAHDCPAEHMDYLLEMFGLDRGDLYPVDGPVNLNRLMAIYQLTSREDLRDAPFTPGQQKAVVAADNLFAAIAERDILLHHPFESFSPVIDFVGRAALDPDVLALKMTLYRTGPDSPIVDALVRAAQAGKEVTVSIELRARFDEAANIKLANRLQEAGAHIVYGVVGFKTHCKLALVVRREGGRLRRYVHLGTGNYHTGTARRIGQRLGRKSNVEPTNAALQTSVNRTTVVPQSSPAGRCRVAVRGLLASKPQSTSRLKAIAADRAKTMQSKMPNNSRIENCSERERHAKMADNKANGIAKSVWLNRISSSRCLILTHMKIRTRE